MCKNYFESPQKGRPFNSNKNPRVLKENTDRLDYIKLLLSTPGQNYRKESKRQIPNCGENVHNCYHRRLISLRYKCFYKPLRKRQTVYQKNEQIIQMAGH